MFGITPMPIYDPRQHTAYLREFMIFFRPGDIVKFKPIGRAEYDQLLQDVEANVFIPRQQAVTFSLDAFEADPVATNHTLLEALHGR